jgi:hypothetical protein
VLSGARRSTRKDRGNAPADGPTIAAVPDRRARALEALALLVAGALAVAAAASPWWFTRTVSPGTSSTAEYYPGGSFYAGGGGGGGTTTYSAYGLTLVGGLYEAILGATLLLALVAWAVAALGLRRPARSPASQEQGHRRRKILCAATAASLGLLVAVPALQPWFYRSDDPGGSCSVGATPGPCSSFWGSTDVSGVSRMWGAGAGWWVELAVAVLLALTALSSVLRARRARLRPREGTNDPAVRGSASRDS